MTTSGDRPRRSSLRLALWSSPLLVALPLWLGARHAEVRAMEREAGSLLVAGEVRAARHHLAAVRWSATGLLPRDRAWVRAGFAVADVLSTPVLGGHHDEMRFSEDELASLEFGDLRLPLIVRTAFERGEFRAALRLTALADELGRPTVPLLTAAALIEEGGRSGEARALLRGTLRPGGRTPGGRTLGTLARRLEHHLGSPREQRGVLLRDRDGRPIGTVAGGELELFDEVRPELVPRAVADLVASGGRLAGEPAAGSLRLSLDLELSAVAYAAFGRYYRGSIVLLDARSGEILAAVSDRHTLQRGGTPAFEQHREPASIAKLITTTAALRHGLDPDAELARMRCRGHERYAGRFLYCPYIAGPLRGLDRALAVSCNVAFANLGVRIGRAAVVREHRRYGFDAPIGPFPGGRLLRPHGDDRQLADLSIGLQATEVTPLHAALLAAVVANDGVIPAPILVIAEDGRLGLHPRPLPAVAGRRVIEAGWVPEIRHAMEAVARRGTGSGMAPHTFPVAMKTGTASDPRWGFHVNYIGVGPLPESPIAFCVRVTDQPTSRKVRIAAREVTRRLLRGLGRIAEKRGWRRASAPEPRYLDRPAFAVADRGAAASRSGAPAPRPAAGAAAR